MPIVVVRKGTDRIVDYGDDSMRYDARYFDNNPVAVLPTGDPAGLRWNGVAVVVYVPSDAEKSALASNDFDASTAIRAVAGYFVVKLNELRALHSLPPITAAEARQGIIDRYKALL